MRYNKKQELKESMKRKEPEKSKSVIYYHRAYRKLPAKSTGGYLIEFFLLFFFFVAVIFHVFPWVTELTSYFSKYILSFVMPPNTLVIMRKSFLSRDFYMISRIGKFPSPLFLLISIQVTLAAAFLFTRIKSVPKSLGIWILYVCILNIISSLFFLYMPDRFPYNIEIFSELYMKTQVTIWFFISIVIPLALTPFRTGIFTKGLIITSMLLYSIVFGCLRYIVFFYILTRYSYVFMTVLFFALGPLIDFVYIIGLYSFSISSLSVKMKGDLIKWKWSY